MITKYKMVLACLLARCGVEAKIERSEIEFIEKTYSPSEVVSTEADKLTYVYLKLSLK